MTSLPMRKLCVQNYSNKGTFIVTKCTHMAFWIEQLKYTEKSQSNSSFVSQCCVGFLFAHSHGRSLSMFVGLLVFAIYSHIKQAMPRWTVKCSQLQSKLFVATSENILGYLTLVPRRIYSSFWKKWGFDLLICYLNYCFIGSRYLININKFE
jgi:hypothetical protein